MRTSSDEVSIHAVSPLSIFDAGAAGAPAGAGAPAAGAGAAVVSAAGGVGC
jgi:hypothetical protein